MCRVCLADEIQIVETVLDEISLSKTRPLIQGIMFGRADASLVSLMASVRGKEAKSAGNCRSAKRSRSARGFVMMRGNRDKRPDDEL